MQHVGATVRKIFAGVLRREGAKAPLLAWALACGSRIAERASALAFANGVLIVGVPDRTWQQQLQGFSAEYLTALNQLSAEPVSRIEFVIVNQAENVPDKP